MSVATTQAVRGENVERARSTAVVEEGDSLFVYVDRRKLLRSQHLHAVFLLIPLMYLNFVVFSSLAGGLPSTLINRIILALEPSFIVTLTVAAYLGRIVMISQWRRPVLTISPEGITIHHLERSIGVLRWCEIRDVAAYRRLSPFIGITPVDLDGVCLRAGQSRAMMTRITPWSFGLHRLLGIRTESINIPEDFLPISAADLANRITGYRAAAHADPKAPGVVDDTVWPPPPRTA
ncbi:MAG: hypothetical protein ACLQVD_21850 [Capsulimonadaceae bacterium]